METTFVDGIYWEEWYNDGDMTAEFPCPGYPDHDGKDQTNCVDLMLRKGKKENTVE